MRFGKGPERGGRFDKLRRLQRDSPRDMPGRRHNSRQDTHPEAVHAAQLILRHRVPDVTGGVAGHDGGPGRSVERSGGQSDPDRESDDH